MFVQLYQPHPALRHFVKRITVVQYNLAPALPRPVTPFPPLPEHCLYFYPRDPVTCYKYTSGQTTELPPVIFVGPQFSRVDLTMGYQSLVIRVGFHPGGLHRLLGLPMQELGGEEINAALLLNDEVNTICKQLEALPGLDAMVIHVQQFLLRKVCQLKPILPIEAVLTRMMHSNALLTVDQLAKLAFVSTRQMERQCKERLGMLPKFYLKLVRFSRAWTMREAHPQLSWNAIAHQCHYSDQMHLVRDFKQFTGTTPSLLQHQLDQSPIRLQRELFE